MSEEQWYEYDVYRVSFRFVSDGSNLDVIFLSDNIDGVIKSAREYMNDPEEVFIMSIDHLGVAAVKEP